MAIPTPKGAEDEQVLGAVPLPGVTDRHGESLVALNDVIVAVPLTLTFTVAAAGFCPPNGALNARLDSESDSIVGLVPPPPPHPAIRRPTVAKVRHRPA
jgi:hypothetical protein